MRAGSTPSCSGGRPARSISRGCSPPLVTVANEVRHDDGVTVSLKFEGGQRAFVVPGHDSRLGQVVDNLIDNARSFSPAGGSVRVTCRQLKQEIEIVVDDDGPGVQPDALEKIFERFYTDRPHQGFGQNSGLGLSISKQIVEAHDGRLVGREPPRRRRRRWRPAAGAGRPLHRAPAGHVMASHPATVPGTTVHASAVLAGARAVLIRGPAGAGKSRLALGLIGAAQCGLIPFARLVADDRIELDACHGRLLGAPAAGAGRADRGARARHPPAGP